MIYLFDNCYLSTVNTVVEKSKQVWVGDFNYDSDVNISHSFDILKTYKTITATELDKLFGLIHKDYSDTKVVIYADQEYFSFIYYFFFRAFMSKEGVDSMYEYDMKKENYGLGSSVYGLYVTGKKEVFRIELTPEGKKPRSFSKFAAKVKDIRVEIAFANGLLGNEELKQYCYDRCSLIWKGLPAFRSKYAEQTLPALLSDEEYTIENLTNPEFIKSFVKTFTEDDYMPKVKLEKVKQLFGFDYVVHFFSVVNDNNLTEEQCYELWAKAAGFATKRELIEGFLLNMDIQEKIELSFPSISDFNSVNPILWNDIIRHRNDTSWLAKYGTNNQTDGTV